MSFSVSKFGGKKVTTSSFHSDLERTNIIGVNNRALFVVPPKAILKHANNGSTFHQMPTATVNTPEPVTGSGSINRLVSPTLSPTPFSTPSPTPESSNISNYKVMLLDGEGTPVAKGFVETNSTRGICHGRNILLGEKKIFIEEVLNGDAPLYDDTQNGNSVLQDYMEGGYLVWLEPRLQKL